jgi:Neuraminidase-like domain
MSWSGWEALDLDNANDFIMPFVMAGDLHLAWPVFNKKVDEKDSNHLLWDVQIAWTRRTNQGWVKHEIGSVTLSNVTRLPNKDESASFVFRLTKDISKGIIVGTHPVVQETIKISCYVATEVAGLEPSLGLDAEPPGQVLKGTVPDDGNQWNVSLRVSGTVYRYAIIGTEKTTYSRPFNPELPVLLTYDQKQTENPDVIIPNDLSEVDG